MSAEAEATPVNSTLQQVLLYTEKYGFSVIPLAPFHLPKDCNDDEAAKQHACKTGGKGSKRPALSSWKEYQTRKPSLAELTGWWSDHPDKGVGVICGSASAPEGKCLVLLDFDTEEGYHLLLGGETDKRAPTSLITSRTPVVKTKRGYHVYLYANSPVSTKHVDILPGHHCDIVAEGGYGVMPPTTHPATGKPYQWHNLPDSVADIGNLADFLAGLGYEAPTEGTATSAWTMNTKHWLAEVYGRTFNKGERTPWAVSLAGYLVKRNNRDVAYMQLKDWSDAHCNPPLPDTQLKEIIDGLDKKEQSKLEKTSRIRPLSQVIETHQAKLLDQLRDPKGHRGIPLDFWPHTNRLMGGGLKPGLIYVIAARPGNHKSNFTFEIVRELASRGSSVVCFSVEQSEEAIYKRWTEPEMGFSWWWTASQGLPAGKESQEKFAQASEQMKHWPVYICDEAIITVRGIEQGIEEAEKLNKGPVDFMVLDYINLLSADDEDGGTLYQQMTSWITRLGKVARRKNIPLLVLAQLGRQSEREKRDPLLSDLRESGALEQRADYVIFLEKYKYDQDHVGPRPERVRLMLKKQKDGPGEGEILFEIESIGRKILEMGVVEGPPGMKKIKGKSP